MFTFDKNPCSRCLRMGVHDGCEYATGLMDAVSQQNPPIYNNNQVNPAWDRIMNELKRQPFEAQRERVHAICQLLAVEGEQAAILNGEMGCGKTMMGIAAAAVLFSEGYRRTLVISPPHLVYKWRREILETINDAKVWVLNGPDTLRQLLKIRAESHTKPNVPEFFIIGRVRMRMGFDWQSSAVARKIYQRQNVAETEAMPSRSYISTHQYAACPNCGTMVTDDEGNPVGFVFFMASNERRTSCCECHSPLWTLKRPGKTKSQEEVIHKEICKIPTIGPKTADKLLSSFGSETLSAMLSDNVFEFINLMDDNGDLVFSDRQATRMERALAKQVFSFGQGGYQPTEFIKRYLPDGFFDLLIADEAHEYKNQGSAQGQAMGVLASKARKSVLLTGTMLGGYADDIFYLLWRALPNRMIEDHYCYNANNSLGSAAMGFMREHGVLKDVFKETSSGNHRTAKGKRMTVHTSKAPGFGPKGIVRYVLPYTAFLKLKQIGHVLPSYEERFINVAMMDEQASAYEYLSQELTSAMKKALAKGDKTLLGVVLNVLLAWADTCFREEEVLHPRTKEVLVFVKPVFSENDISPKENELIEICKKIKH